LTAGRRIPKSKFQILDYDRRVRSTPRRALLLLHQWIGLAAALFLIVIAMSGGALVFENEIDRMLNPAVSYVAPQDRPLLRTLNAAPEPAPPQSTPRAGAARIPVDEALAAANAALPGAFASNVNVPVDPRAVYRVLMKFPEDRTPAGRSRVYVDQFSGAVLLVENTRTAPLGTRILNLKRSAHTGDIFGALTRALYFIVGLGIAVQAITGPLIWWNSRRRATH